MLPLQGSAPAIGVSAFLRSLHVLYKVTFYTGSRVYTGLCIRYKSIAFGQGLKFFWGGAGRGGARVPVGWRVLEVQDLGSLEGTYSAGVGMQLRV